MSSADRLLRSVPLQRHAAAVPAADHIISRLSQAGIDTVFGIPGGAIARLYHAARPFETVCSIHEGMAGYQAAGWARTRNLPGVLAVTSGPGLLNLTTPVAAARQDEIPMLVLAGEVSSAHAGRGALQDGREDGLAVLDIFRPICKSVARAERAEEIPRLLEEALATAMEAPRGPVLLALPRDLLEESVAVEPQSTPTRHPLPSISVGSELAGELVASRRPVLWLGIGARSANAGAAALELAEQQRALIVCDLDAKGIVPETHPLYAGIVGPGSCGAAEAALSQADLVLAIGARLDPTSLGSLELDRVTGLDHCTQRASRHGTRAVTDLPAALKLVTEMTPVDPMTLMERDRFGRDRRMPRRRCAPLDEAPHHPGSVVKAMQRHLPDAHFTSDIGNHLLAVSRYLVVDREDRFTTSYGLAGMTSGIGTAMGIALASPEAPVVSFCGDGGLLMAGTELATAVRHRLNVVFAVFDDGAWGMVKDGMNAEFGECTVGELPPVDLVAIARATGMPAERVTSGHDLGRILRRRADGPLLLAFPVGATDEHNPRIPG